MPIYYGKSEDGSDMKLYEGVYHNEVTGMWSNDPKQIFSKDELKDVRLRNIILKHIERKRSLKDEYELIKQKKSKLTKSQRDYLINQFENEKD